MEPIVSVSHVKKSYQKRKDKTVVKAVDDISFQVHKGEIVGLLGPNGAGKTTTIKMICGLLKPNQGTIKIQGLDNSKHRLKSLKHISAVLEGNRNLYWRLTVRENLEYFAGNRGKSKKQVKDQIDYLLELFHLKMKEHELVNRLSRGMQQKLAIAVAMLADTEVILLDEPTLGLDVETSYEVRDILKKIVRDEARTIIISSHDMAVIQAVCERVIIVNNGKIVTDNRVEDLIALFDARQYTITLGQPLIHRQITQLKACFSNFEYESEQLKPKLVVELLSAEQIYQVFDILKKNETPVEDINRNTINFEQVFIKIIKGETGHANHSSLSSKSSKASN
ncbi:ABC transporter ATP-binding protein [Amphibacillus sp. Q70]|uniref:ABC transporter ATP-binding protein n=1 Tax=Amphibacillus sp. Q70 TaxID=3453416 RepID=UPI003F866D12